MLLFCGKREIIAAAMGTVYLVLFHVLAVRSQTLVTDTFAVMPMQIGDTVPESIWNMPLETVQYKGKTKTVELADYRGKVIILDFWATWCMSCINTMPYMHELASAYPGDVELLPVTHENTEVLTRFFDITASPRIQSLEKVFHTIVNGAVLKDLIPHQTLPHIAVINKDGILEQVTKPLYLNKEVIGKMVEKEDYYIPTYLASLDTTLLSPTFSQMRNHKPYYYSTVTGFVDGFMFPYGEIKDSLTGIQKGHYVNRPILQLFNNARSTGLSLLPNRRLIIAENPIILEYHSVRNPNYSHQRFSYSYEYVLPLSMDKTAIRQRMWDDLNTITGYHAQIIEREIPCIVLKAFTDQRKISPSNDTTSMMYVVDGITQERTPREVGRSMDGFLNYMNGVTMNGVVWNLNRMTTGAMPFVIDETGIEYRVNIGFPDDIFDLDLLILTLRDQGIDAVVEIRVMDMFVIADRPIERAKLSNMPVKLTKIGYLPEAHVDID